MPRLFSAEGNVSGYQSVGPEATANAGSPHAASVGAGAVPVGGQHPPASPLSAGGRSFLQMAQMKQANNQPGNTPAPSPPAGTSPPVSRVSGAGALPPGSSAGTSMAPAGSTPGGGTSGWTWTAKVASGVSPSYGGAAYNGGGGPLANRISGPSTGAPAAIGAPPKMIQGNVLPPGTP